MKKQSFKKYFQGFLRQLIPNLGSILVMAAMLFAYNVRAAGMNAGTSPSTISYQGTLSTASGTAVNASVGLTFRLYNVQSGGTALWTEAHTGLNTVPVNNGLFNTLLGSITPVPTAVWNNSTIYLGVQVEGDSVELSPREMVSSVPMAMMAANIIIPDASIITSKIVDGAVTTRKVGLGYLTDQFTIDKAISTSSTTILTLPVNVPYAATYMIVLNLGTALDQVDQRAIIWLKDEAGNGLTNYHIPASITGNNGTTSEIIYQISSVYSRCSYY